MKDDPGILSRQSVDDGGSKSRRHGFGASDPQLSSRGVDEELELLDTLLELVEHGEPAFEQRVAIDGRLDSVWSPVEKTQSDRVLNLCDRACGGGMVCLARSR